MTMKGVDISKYQSDIDWDKVKKSNITFAIIRCSCGTTTDRLFHTHMKNALINDIATGVYCYSLAADVNEARKEADNVISLIKDYNITFPVCYDMEDKIQLKLTDSERTDIAISFLERIENAGYYAMLYANRDWLTNRYNTVSLVPYDTWLAEWIAEPKYKGNYGIWQYGLDYVDGIGNCDCDIAYKNYPSIISNMNRRNGTDKNIKIGSLVSYKGLIRSSSFGLGKKLYISGNYIVSAIFKGRPYGVLLDNKGWVNIEKLNIR